VDLLYSVQHLSNKAYARLVDFLIQMDAVTNVRSLMVGNFFEVGHQLQAGMLVPYAALHGSGPVQLILDHNAEVWMVGFWILEIQVSVGHAMDIRELQRLFMSGMLAKRNAKMLIQAHSMIQEMAGNAGLAKLDTSVVGILYIPQPHASTINLHGKVLGAILGC
jgi:hypothetical protein